MNARLQVTDAQGRRVVPLDKPHFTIGRRSGSDLQVAGADVSRDHAEISRVDGRFVIRDRGSRYGTSVNGDALTADRGLEHGDRIRLGRADGAELVLLTELDEPAMLLRDTGTSMPDLRQMSALLDGLRALGSGRVVEDVLTTVVDLAIDVTGADRGFVMLADATGRLALTVCRMKGRLTIAARLIDTSRKIPEEVFRSGRTRAVGDLMEGTEAGGHQGTIALGIRHVLCAPLRVVHQTQGTDAPHDRVIGVLYLDGRERGRLLSRTTLESLETFATQAAMAIESARLYAESAEKARLDRDLKVAGDIQQGLLPAPEFSGATFDLAATSIACRTIGGDFYDYLELDGDHFGFSLGDVAGKGPPAALLATAVQSLAAAQSLTTGDPAETLARINKGLLRRTIQSRFATMFYGVLASDGSLRYSSAGHEPPALVHASGVDALEAGGLVLGLFPTATYDSGTATLDAGDIVVVVSDGVTEARNPSDEEFGRDRFVATVAELHGREPAVVLARLLQAVRDFTSGAPQADDVTVVVVRHRGAATSWRSPAP